MSVESTSEPLLNGELPVSSGGPANGDAPSAGAPAKPFSGGELGKRLGRGLSDGLAKVRAASQEPSAEAYLGIAISAGVVCGLVAFTYSTAFGALLDLVWKHVPEKLVLPALQRLHQKHAWWPHPGNVGECHRRALVGFIDAGCLHPAKQCLMGDNIV